MGETLPDRPSNKVARLLNEYDLEGFGAELEARWTGKTDERMSLRGLAELFNKRLLERAMLDAGISAIESDVEATYENLTSDDVSTAVRMDTRNRLNQKGIKPDDLESDFVTYQAIRTYLKEWRGAEYDHPSDAEKIKKDRESVQRLMTRTLSVIEDRIEKLRDTNRVNIDQFEVILDVKILCQQCGRQQSVADFLDQKGCKCHQE